MRNYHSLEDAKRRRLLGLIGAGLALPAVLREAAAQQLVPSAQGIRQLRGEVTVNGAPASAGTGVGPGDTVATGPNAYTMFVVGQDAYLLRENSRAVLGGKELFIDALRLVTGKLLGVFGRSRQRRELATGVVTIGIRGTGGYLEAYPDRQLSYFCLCYGAADIGAADGGAREVFVSQYHEAPRYIYGDGRADAITAAPVLNHSDSELLMLEGLVDRRPPQTFLDRSGRY